MICAVAHQLDALEAHRVRFSRQLNALDPAIVHASPGSGAWSLAQIAEHLLLIDRELGFDGEPSSWLGSIRSRVGSVALRSVLSLPVRILAPPSAQSVMPSESPSWPEVREAWDSLRSSWRTALSDVSPDAIVYPHPLAGRLCREDALAFLLAHHRHHDAQVQRTLCHFHQRTTATRRTTRVSPTSATSA